MPDMITSDTITRDIDTHDGSEGADVARASVPQTGMRQLCTFRVDDLFFGVEVLEVQEVIRNSDITEVPLAPKEVSGLINLRGQIVTAIDLRTRLGRPPRTSEADGGSAPINVVVRTADDVVSLLVDEISDVMHLAAEALEDPPSTMPHDAREVITGVFQLDGKLLLALDIDAALSTSG